MPPTREILPWALAVLLVLIFAIVILWINQPVKNALPDVYGVM